MLEDSKDASISQVLGSSGSGDGLLNNNNNNNVNSAKTHQVVVSESNNNIIGGSNSISGGDEEDRVGIIDNPLAKFEEGDRSFGGNRWPRQETLALLQIRSDMDVAFRDASVKAPLWDVVSRKLAELGYNRSSKKCKEKFENVYKYHKRTKEGRSGKSDGKTYRFFDQLKALENHAHHHPHSPHIQTPSTTMVVTTMNNSNNNNNPPLTVSHQNTTVPSVSHHQQPNTINLTFPSFQTPSNPTILPPPLSFQPSTAATANINTNTSAFQSISTDNLFSNSTSSSTSSDEEVLDRNMRRNKKRKWKDFFERLMVEVIQKQEELQNKFLEAIEKREHERMVREEAWRMQELSRINREREILSQERSMAAAKDSAVMAFLQKFSEKQNQNQNQNQHQNIQNIIPQPSVQPPVSLPMPKLAPTSVTQPSPLPQLQQMIQPRQNVEINTPTTKQAAADNNGEENELMRASSSRWPKVEIEALIKLRSTLDSKYQENSPKGPLWEEISGSMKELGYNRNAKRCKEKWENINKYYKKVKESNKKRPEDSKTCPYFSQLEALYKEKNKFENTQMNQIMKPEINSIPMMVRPEQQWPPQQENKNNEEDDPMDQNHEDGDEDEDEDDDESDGNYEFVANKPANSNNSIAVGSATAV